MRRGSKTCESCLDTFEGSKFFTWGYPADLRNGELQTRERRGMSQRIDTIPSEQRYLLFFCIVHRETDIKRISSDVGKAPVVLAAWVFRGSEWPQRLQNSKLCCGFFRTAFRTSVTRSGSDSTNNYRSAQKSTGKGTPTGYLTHLE